MNDLYSRKNLSKFQAEVNKNSQDERKAVCARLKRSFKVCHDGEEKELSKNLSQKILGTNSKNGKYLKTNGWVSRKSSVSNFTDKKKGNFTSRRRSTKI